MYQRFRRLKHQLNKLNADSARLAQQTRSLERSLLLQGHIATSILRSRGQLDCIHDAEFTVFSQFGEDGIIQYLTQSLGLSRGRFVEFGVENYEEANTRFLLQNNNWSGLVLDGSAAHITTLRKQEIMWRHDLTAECAFITSENINELLLNAGFASEVDLLSIDIDGNDYHVWEAIDCIHPALVVAEYNSVFGLAPVTVPYSPTFRRTEAHYSNLYFGCSISALVHLAKTKGYTLVGCNSAGNNSFFVREDLAEHLPSPSVEEAYVESSFRESRDKNGRLSFISGRNRLDQIANLPVIDVTNGNEMPLSSISTPR